ncbi:MAG: phosphoglucomutase/phosphomannomutase family protein [Halobacteriaceae archaeon]
MQAISFGTDGWRAKLDEFTTERVQIVTQGIANHLQDIGGGGGSVAIGYDARKSSPAFARSAANTLADNGFTVLLSQTDCPTPAAVYSIADRDLQGAIVISASHNPPEYNGIKFFPSDAAPAMPDVTNSIESRLTRPVSRSNGQQGDIHEVDFINPHLEHARNLIDVDLEDLTVVYDAMHGSGREATPRLLESTGADVIQIRCERDPSFGGTPPEPSEENLQPLVNAVNENEADIGIANDGDADRIAIVTPDRGFLDENLFFGAIYSHLLESDSGPAIRTVSTTFLIDCIAEAHGESVIEVPVGFKWVADAMEEHDALIGGEESGGFSIRGHIREKDGVLLALVASEAAKSANFDDRITELLETHGEIHQSKTSIDCPDERKQAVLEALGQELPSTILDTPVDRVNDTDGFKILLEDGAWLLIRPSGTEPKLRIYAEAESRKRVENLLDFGKKLITPLI